MDSVLKGLFKSITVRDNSIIISNNVGQKANEILLYQVTNFIFEKGTAFKYGYLTICTSDGKGYNVDHGKSASDKNSITFNSKVANEFELLYLRLRSMVKLKTYEELKPKTVEAPEIRPIHRVTVPAQLPHENKKSFWQQTVEQGRAINAAKAAQPKPLTKRERIKDNKANAVACCPKCGSTSLSANKKGFGIGKAVVGAGAGLFTAGTAGLIGLTAGNAGAKKVIVTCLNCGHHWKA